MGLFGKSKKELLEWQRLIMPDVTKLVLTEQQLQVQTLPIMNRHIQIAKDCIKLVNTTANPDTYFSRYDLLISELELLCKFQKFVKFSSLSPRDNLNNVLKNKVGSINAFIDRYWDSVVKKTGTLKTDSAKKNQYSKFFDSMQKYEKSMSPENISHYKSKL